MMIYIAGVQIKGSDRRRFCGIFCRLRYHPWIKAAWLCGDIGGAFGR
jgi:hypothetical protein